MDLKTFVSEALIEITEGASEAQEEIFEMGGAVNPMVRSKNANEDNSKLHGFTGAEHSVFIVDFDVAVTLEETEDVKGGIRFAVSNMGFGTEAGSTTGNTEANRVRFQIPLMLPMGDDPNA